MKIKNYKIDPNMYSHMAYLAIQEGYANAQINRAEFFTPEHLLLQIASQEPFIEVAQKMDVDVSFIVESLKEHLRGLDTIPEESSDTTIPSNGLMAILSHCEKVSEEIVSPIELCDILYAIEAQTESYASFIINEATKGDCIPFINQVESQYENDIIESDYNPENTEDTPPLPFDEVEKPEKKEDKTKKPARKGAGIPTDMIAGMLPPNIQGISITLGLAGKMLEGIGNGKMGPSTEKIQEELNRRRGKKKEEKREPWEDMVTCLNDVYMHRNPLIGREAELERTIEILCRKDKNNPLHIGESGVGKTALVYGLARKLEMGEVPESLLGFKIYMMDMGTLVAGASYHGEFERRLKEIMDGISRRGKSIVYIDEIHNIMGAGSTNGSPMDASNMLKPYLEEGTIRFIGSTTYQEYNRHMANSKSIVRRFQQIDILEPSVEDTLVIIKGIIHDYEVHHHVKYEEDAIKYAVEQSARLIADRFLPDKAIDIIDEAGSYRQTHPLYNKKGEKMTAGRQKVDSRLIGDILSKVCKVSAKALAEENNASLKNLQKRISAEIYGQDNAVEQVVRAVKMSKAGLTMGDKPLASLLFVGPTGVGKTEVCKVLAQELGVELVRFDMSEYTEKHTVAKLIGSPAGYVGYDDGGLLTDAIRKTPNCVLLLDEIEKAHHDIFNILLQVMDYAKLTDNKGNKIDFKNVILIMTSNAGAQFAGQASIGFGGGSTKGEAMLQSVKKTFKPEFINRLSGTVVFHDMDKTMASLILDKKLRQLSDLLKAKNVTIDVTTEAHDLLLEKGFTTQYGAREMDRVIQGMLNPLLMDEILFGKLAKGGNATVERDGENLKLKC